MLFNSYIFLSFMAVVYALYLVLKPRQQNVMLLVASYMFYGAWDWRFCSLLLISTVIDYYVAQRVQAARADAQRKAWLLASLLTNLGILFSFKYFGFFYDSLVQLGAAFGLQLDSLSLRIILPVGISFYTFQTLSYTIDVYRGRVQPCRRMEDFALYVAFFPQLVAGPIERSSHLLPQIEGARRVTLAGFRDGAWLVLLGYYKKVVLADNVAPYVNLVFGEPAAASGMAIPIAILAFAIQIYGDFSGYTDIARGISRWMGFDLMENFSRPYFALSPKQFWQRWHISLSTWLRDYLYLPLGGNRRGPGRTYFNLMATMVLGGLWHGAAWNFLLWGFYQGLLLVVDRVWRLEEPLERLARQRLSPAKLLVWAQFMVMIGIGWMFFRVESLGDLGLLFSRMTEGPFFSGKAALLTMLVYGLPVLAVDLYQERRGSALAVKGLPLPLRYGLYLLLFAIIVISGVRGGGEFIYFQF